jgi:peptide/nickel transport system substrate-binding protein
MITRRAGVLALALLMLVSAGCSAPAPTPSPSPTPRPTGGLLRVGSDLADYEFFQRNEEGTFDGSWDPTTTWAVEAFLLFHCCLLRTLMSNNGRAFADGGAAFQPDLADGYPQISADGLTWTFDIKEGIRYAPPMDDTFVTSTDFVRALERALRQSPHDERDRPFPFNPYSKYFSEVIAGAEEFTLGAASISGLETPSPQQLVIHLKRPAGDLGARLAMPATAPIPPGAADGHDSGYGFYLVASGPYMIEGSDQLRPDLPPEQQPRVSGYVPGTSLTLVRSPSWDAATDPLRASIPDRIEIVQMAYDDQLRGVLDDEIDIGLNLDLFPEEVAQLRDDPGLGARLHVNVGQASDWIMLNVAQPPFDDLAVRRAIQFATERQALLSVIQPSGIVQAHMIPDAFSNGLLSEYDPYGVRDLAADPQKARAEMAQSRYDTNGDGICDAPECSVIPLPFIEERQELADAAATFASQMTGIGLTFDIEPVPFDDYWPAVTDPASHTPMAFTAGWGSDYLNASSWFVPLAASSSIGDDFGLNLSLLGASADELAEWGYETTSVPSVDRQIDACVALTGTAQFECWARLDQYMTERVAAWVPVDTRRRTTLTSSYVTSFEFDDWVAMPSLGRIVVTRP